MSKVSFRARQIDFNKPLPILRNDSDILPEFSDNALVNRGVPQIPSGMEKEEENEHHFVEVIQSSQLGASSNATIPVPDVIDLRERYEDLYIDGFVPSKQFIHIRTILLSEKEPVDYDMDSEDEEWLQRSDLNIAPEKFESMIDRLERGCGQKVMNLEEAKYLLQDDPSLVIAVYDYWLNKRVQSRQPLIFSVRQERRDVSSNTDPYVAFRRRTEKMQTRKNRKNDEQSYEKMLILREQMDALGEILSRLVQREVMKEALVQNECGTFDVRYKLGDWDLLHQAEAESIARKSQISQDLPLGKPQKDTKGRRTSKKRKVARPMSDVPVRTLSSEDVSEAEAEDGPEFDGPFTFVRLPGCRYLRPRNLYDSQEERKRPSPWSYELTTVPSVCHSTRRAYTGYIRRRLGRGGRIVYDRVPAPSETVSRFLHAYDDQMKFHDDDKLRSNDINPSYYPSPKGDLAIFARLQAAVFNAHPQHPSFSWPRGVPVRRHFEQRDMPMTSHHNLEDVSVGQGTGKKLANMSLHCIQNSAPTEHLPERHSPPLVYGSRVGQDISHTAAKRMCNERLSSQSLRTPPIPVRQPSCLRNPQCVGTTMSISPASRQLYSSHAEASDSPLAPNKFSLSDSPVVDASDRSELVTSMVTSCKSRRIAHNNHQEAVPLLRSTGVNHDLHTNGKPDTSLPTAHILAT